MPPTYFKFTTPEGLNRRLTFSEKPTWPLLASKLHVLYGISPDNVGVSYLDNDNDVITVSSDEELQDFYKVSHQAGQVIKFAVVDLHFSQTNGGKPFEFSSLSRNPFDADAFEFEWERLPPDVLMEEDRPRSGPHGFVEVLSSSHSVAHDEMDTEEEDDHSAVRPPLLNKGKGRALSFGSASIASVLGEEISHKHPIHVYDLNSRKDDKAKDNNFDDPSVHIHVAAQSTPKVQAKNIDDNIGTKETPASAKAVEVEDPPLPSLDETPASATSASLFHDLTSLVHDVTQAVSSHPELSEGLRNIGRNISNGTYWTNHREALSETVKGMSNSPLTEERRQAEEEAGARRLADVVSNLFRSLSQVPVDTEDTPAPNINENHSDQFRGENVAPVTPPWLGFQGVRYGPMGLRSSYHHGRFPPFPHAPGYRPHMAPVYHPHAPHGSPHNGRPKPPRQSPFPFPHAPPVPPPPPPHTPLGAPPSHHPSPPHDHFSPVLSPPGTAQSSLGQQDIHILPPPVPSPNRIPAPMPDVQPSSEEMQSRGPSVNDRRQSYPGPSVSFFSLAGDQPRSQSSKPNAQDQRAQVEAAKRIYKAEKERYRQERDQRRREKLGRKPTVGHSATDGSGAVAQAEEHEMSSIQFQNMYPGVERVDVPRRSNTHLGHGPFQHLDKEPEDLTIRAMIRIAKKLSDMGFSENAYPTLPEKIKAQMPPNGAISKEVEDDVVTTLLEELLATASTGASGSG